jgi:hypothetical protein
MFGGESEEERFIPWFPALMRLCASSLPRCLKCPERP